MLGSVFTKTLRDLRRALIGWGVGLIAFAVYAVALYPSIRGRAQDLNRFLEELPEGFKALFGRNVVDFGSPEGYLSTQFFSLMVPLLFLIFAVGQGARTLAGEERSGRLELLLATPVPRWRLVAEKLGAVSVAGVVLSLVLWGTLAVGAPLADMDISALRLGAATTGAALLGLSFGAAALATGAATGSRGVALGVTSALAMATYLINALAPLVDWLEGFRPLSPFKYYLDNEPLRHGLDVGDTTVLATLILAFGALALAAFERRDVAV